MDWLTEPWQFDFMLAALMITLMASLVCGIVSCWLVLIGWSLMGDADSHAVLPGVVLAYVVGLPFALGALVFGLAAVALIGLVRSTSRIKEDAAIGTVFTTLFALGLVLVSVTPSDVDLNHIIFGNVLGISDADILQVGILSLAVTTALLIKRRDLVLFAFDPAHAHVIGLSVRGLSALLLVALALTSVVALQAVGVVLVVALLIIPGATAYLLTDRFMRMLLIAPTMAMLCAVVGLHLSFHFDTAPGPMVVLVHSVCFALTYLGAPRHGVLGRAIRHRRRIGRVV